MLSVAWLHIVLRGWSPVFWLVNWLFHWLIDWLIGRPIDRSRSIDWLLLGVVGLMVCPDNFKMHGAISRNRVFYLKNVSLPQRSWLQISIKLVKLVECMKRLQLPIPYCVNLIVVTITSHILINILQIVHFSALKFTMGYEKNMSFRPIFKSHKIWKNLN